MVRLYHQILPGKARGQDGEALLRRILNDPALKVYHDEKGRPYLPEGPFISISHSENHLVVAISEENVGVDCQLSRAVYPGLPRRVMSGSEYEYYQAQGQDPTLFFTLWTLKESYYKYLGTGLTGFPNKTEFYLQDGLWQLRGEPQKFHVLQKKDLLIALCCDEQEFQLITPE